MEGLVLDVGALSFGDFAFWGDVVEAELAPPPEREFLVGEVSADFVGVTGCCCCGGTYVLLSLILILLTTTSK
jgi:hypothetical protein